MIMKIRKIKYSVADDLITFLYDSVFSICRYRYITNKLHGDVTKEVIEYLQERNLEIKNLDEIVITE